MKSNLQKILQCHVLVLVASSNKSLMKTVTSSLFNSLQIIYDGVFFVKNI